MTDWLAEIHARPDDDAPRLAYAAHLRAAGDPRGDWIALQCAAAARPREQTTEHDELRARALWQHHGAAWFREDTGLDRDALDSLEQIEYRRGLPYAVTLPLARALAHAEQLARFPIASLRVFAIEDEAELAQLARCELLRTVRSLELGYGVDAVEASAIQQLLESPRLARLDGLAITPHGDAPDALDALLAYPRLGDLTRLELANIALGPRAPELARRLTRLESLSLRASATGCTGAELLALAQDASFRLRSLELWDRDGVLDRTKLYGDAAVAQLLAAPITAALEELRLYGCELRARSAEALASMPCAPGLITLGLDIEANPELLAALAAAPFARLRGLNTGLSYLRDADLAALDGRGFDQLEALRFARGAIGPAGASALIERFRKLRHLDLCGNPVQDLGAEAIANCPNAASLRGLNLSDTGLTAAGVRALCESAYLRQLRELNLAVNKLGRRGARVLADAPFDAMAQLNLGYVSPQEIAPVMGPRWLPIRTHSYGSEIFERRLEPSGRPSGDEPASAAPAHEKPAARRRAAPRSAPASAREYDPRGTYAVGDVVRHAEWGEGPVRQVYLGVIMVHFAGLVLRALDVIPADAVPYSAQRRFAPGELVHHAKFGVGTVVDVVADRAVIDFTREGRRTLVHALGPQGS